MTTAEASPNTLGPRYAPEDPTLPEPWKGLIDGSTGLLYYWNPETNVTQYEKPTSLPPPLPPGPPSTAPMPKMNPIPGSRTSLPENVQTPQGQQPPHGKILSSSSQSQITSQMGPGHIQGSHLGSTKQHGHLGPEQVRPQMTQQPGQQVPSQLGQMPTQPGQGHPQSMQQISMQPGNQAPYQLMQQMPHAQQGQMYPGAQMGTPQDFQFTHRHTQYAMHQPNMPPQGPPSFSEQSQHLMVGQQLPQKQEHKKELGQRDDTDSHQGRLSGFSSSHQHLVQGKQYPPREQQAGIPHRDDVEFQQVNQAGFSPAPVQQTGTPPVQNLTHKMSIQSNQSAHYGGSIANMQTNNPSVHLQPTGTDLTHPQHVSRFQNQMGPGKMHGQQQNHPPVGSNMPYEENQFGRPGNEYFYTAPKDVNAAPHQLPKLAPLPISRSQQDQTASDFPSQNVAPSLTGRLNVGLHLPGGYGHPSGGPPYPNNAFVRPPAAMMGPSDPSHLSAAEIYRQKHEVTATGENVPAPFMTFEAAGFPPELLQEVRYLLRGRSTCRTLQCYAHNYATTILSF